MNKNFNLSNETKSRLFRKKYSDKLMAVTESDVRSIHKVTSSDSFTIKSLLSLAKTAVAVSESTGEIEGEYTLNAEIVDLKSVKGGASADRKSRNAILDFLDLDNLESNNYTVVKMQRGPKYLFAFVDKAGVTDFYLYMLTPLAKNTSKSKRA